MVASSLIPIPLSAQSVLLRCMSHAAHDRQRIFSRRAAMFSGSRLAHTQLGVLATAPANCKHCVARLLVDIDDNVDNQSPQQLLAGTPSDARRIPRLPGT